MLTIKIFLSDSGRSASVDKSFPLFQGQWQDKLLNVYVPTAILQPPLTTVNYIGQTSGGENPADPADEADLNTLLDDYVLLQTRESAVVGDCVYYIYQHDGTDAYYVCTKTASAWNCVAVAAFPPIVSGAAAVSVGSIATKRNGLIVKSQPYYMRYLKACVVNGVEYALYERRLPSAFTAYDGVSANAPEIVVNVTNMQDGEIVSIITSQKVYLDVLPSTVLDAEPPADPSQFEELVGRVSEIEAVMPTKQNKAIPDAHTTAKTVEGAINELHDQTARNTADVSSLDDRMDKVETAITTGENYVGVYSASSLPTDSDLEEFVDEQVGRDPQEGDVVIAILEISGAPDKSYKYIYSSLANNGLGGWIYYEVPPLSPASNLSLGLIKGTYTGSIGSDLVYVDIVDGVIKNIYAVVTVGGSPSLVRLDVTAQRVENIISGAQVVGNAARAVADASGNNIVSTYLTQSAGATKQFVRDYALPRTFNDVHYLNVDGSTASYDKTLDPTSDYTDVEAEAIGDFDLFTATYTLGDETFQLGAQNIYSAKFFVSVTTGESVQLRLTTSIKPTADAAPITASVELTGVVALTSGAFVQFNNNLSSLTGVVTMQQGGSITQTLTVVRTVSSANTFKVYSNSTYPSTLYLQTASSVKYYEAAEKGQIEFVSCGTPALDSGNAVSVCTLPLGVSLVDEAEYFFEIPAASFADNTPVMVEFDGTQYPILMPYGNATAKDMAQTYFVGGDWWVFVGVFVGVGFVAETPNLNGKADKLAGATAGNLAEFDATGNIADSGVPADNVAQQDGSYDLFTAGLAKNFQGRANTAVSANFTFREAGGSADIGNPQATIKSIHGNTLVWNQLVQNGNFANTSVWTTSSATLAVSNNVGTMTASADNGYINNTFKTIAGHKYLCFATLKSSTTHFRLRVYYNNLGSNLSSNLSHADTKETVYITFTETTSGTNNVFRITTTFNAGNGESVDVANCMCFDLTAMFGAGNEPTTVEAFKALFPLPYYAYDAGSLLNFNGTGLKTVGFNAFNEVWEPDTYINSSTGVVGTANNYSTTDWIPVIAGQSYYIKVDATDSALAGCVLARYDADKNFVSSAVHQVTSNWANRIITIPNGVAFVRFYVKTTAIQNVCVNLSHSGYRNSEYEPYWTSTLALPVATYFPTGMKSAGTVYDELTEKKAIQRVGVVDLGTLDWAYNSTTKYFETSVIADIKNPATNQTVGNIACARYSANSYYNLYWNIDRSLGIDKAISVNSSKIQICDLSYSDAAAFKAAMSGVMLAYETTTPVETDVDLNFTYKVDDFGTEQILPESGTSPFVGTIHYAMNAVDKLSRLPDPPSVTGYYTVYYNATTGKETYVAEGSRVYQHDISMKNSSDEWLYFTCVNKNPAVTYDNGTNKLTGVPNGTYAAHTVDYGAGVAVVMDGSVTFYYSTSSKAWDGSSGVMDTATKIY
jgi:hypothetical protein